MLNDCQWREHWQGQGSMCSEMQSTEQMLTAPAAPSPTAARVATRQRRGRACVSAGRTRPSSRAARSRRRRAARGGRARRAEVMGQSRGAAVRGSPSRWPTIQSVRGAPLRHARRTRTFLRRYGRVHGRTTVKSAQYCTAPPRSSYPPISSPDRMDCEHMCSGRPVGSAAAARQSRRAP